MKLKQGICAALAALTLTTAVSAAGFPDAQGHWAQANIDRWSACGVVAGGSDGLFRPNNSITRAEMAVILTAVCGWTEQAENVFADMTGQEWYASYVLKAHAAGAMAGADGRIRPNDPITRQEAAVMLYKALYIPTAQEGAGKTFTDQAQVASWAASQVAAMSAGGYIAGAPDGSFGPTRHITRAETVTILNKAVPGFYYRAGAISRNVDRAVIKAPGVTLQNMTVAGDLMVFPGAAGAETTLYNLTVGGHTILQSGLTGLIEVGGESSFQSIEISADGGRVKLGEDVEMEELTILSSDVRITGVPRGTPVTVAEGTEKVYVNGHPMAPGVSEAERGDDPFVDGPVIDIVVE